jgi:hypothetical protein
MPAIRIRNGLVTIVGKSSKKSSRFQVNFLWPLSDHRVLIHGKVEVLFLLVAISSK